MGPTFNRDESTLPANSTSQKPGSRDSGGPNPSKPTPPKINMEPKNGGGWKTIFLFNWVIFRFHVNFQRSKSTVKYPTSPVVAHEKRYPILGYPASKLMAKRIVSLPWDQHIETNKLKQTNSSGWCLTPNQLLICSSFNRENDHPMLICSSLSTSQSSKYPTIPTVQHSKTNPVLKTGDSEKLSFHAPKLLFGKRSFIRCLDIENVGYCKSSPIWPI